MGMYESFAEVYDTFMDNVPYEKWGRYLHRLLVNDGIKDGLVLDLGCGTGTMTRYLQRAGYDMIGADMSMEMLEIAREKGPDDILYLLQDMREFELYGTVRAIVSVCDCINYITEEEDLLRVFRLVNNYLDPGGLFIFDMNTVYKYRHILGDHTFAETREECSFIWENSFYEDEMINEYDLTLFLDEGDDMCRRFCETHYQKAWTKKKVCSLLRKAGMELVSVSAAYSEKEPDRKSDRLLFVAREMGKTPLASMKCGAGESSLTI